MPFKILDKVIDFTKIDTWNTLIGVIGFLITMATLIVSNNARRAVQKIQNDLTFAKRIPEHLNNIDKLLKRYNVLLENIPGNKNAINILLSTMISELNSVSKKVNSKEIQKLIKQAKNEILAIRKYNNNDIIDLKEYMLNLFSIKTNNSSLEVITWNCYVTINEVYNTLKNIQKDKATRLKNDV